MTDAHINATKFFAQALMAVSCGMLVIQNRRDLDMLFHEKGLSVTRLKIAEDIDKLSKKMHDASNVESSRRWQGSKLEVEVEHLAALNFRWFLVQAFFPWNRP